MKLPVNDCVRVAAPQSLGGLKKVMCSAYNDALTLITSPMLFSLTTKRVSNKQKAEPRRVV